MQVPETPSNYEVRPYKPEDAPLIYRKLEEPNWAPWLRASEEVLAKRAEVFPEGQIAIWGVDGQPVANINLSRFNYDGDASKLPTWDELMGTPATGEKTFDLTGNAVGMMSINVDKEHQGGGLTRVIIESVKNLAPKIGVKHVMGSFRPSQFGEYSHAVNPSASFSAYIRETRPEDRLPIDAWLRALTRNGMRMLRVDDAGMVVPDVPREKFDEYKRTYRPDRWRQLSPSVWRCGETGLWLVGDKSATYVESNVWGILDQNGNSNGNPQKSS